MQTPRDTSIPEPKRATAIAILAGGQSQRMGQDKAQMPWNGAPMIEQICRVALATRNRVLDQRTLDQQVLVVGRERPVNWLLDDIVFQPDEDRGIGPLGGLKTALHWARDNGYSAVLALPCDVPLLSSDAIQWLLQHGFGASEDGIITLSGEQLQPLFAIYDISCLTLIDELLERQKRSLHALVFAGDFQFEEAPPEIARQTFESQHTRRMAIGAIATNRDIMKIRWTNSSVRLRITPDELAQLRVGNSIDEQFSVLYPAGWRVHIVPAESTSLEMQSGDLKFFWRAATSSNWRNQKMKAFIFHRTKFVFTSKKIFRALIRAQVKPTKNQPKLSLRPATLKNAKPIDLSG